MTVLWMAVIAALAIVLGLRPLWSAGGGRSAQMRRRALNVAGYRSRLAEIDAEVAAGTISADAAGAIRDEAAARLLADTDADQGDAARETAERRSWTPLVAGGALVAVLSGLGYYLGDSREVATWIARAKADPQTAQQLAVDSMVQRLERRLQDTPDDAQGWAMLGRSYAVLGRYADAAIAYERANRLAAVSPNADWLADEAEARIAMQGDDQRGDLQGLPRQLFERAIAIDPLQPKALWYAGLAAAQAGEYGAALDRWLALRGTELPDDFRATLDSHLSELAQLADRELPEQAAAPAADAVQLTLQIDVDPALAQAIGAGDTLFVVARRPDAPGPPLAVQRLAASSLPATVTLDDSNAMAPGVKLSAADQWDVIARISRSGNAQAQSGDLEGRLVVARAQASEPIRLRIDRRIP